MTHTPGPWVIDVTRAGKRGPATTLMIVAERGGMPGLIVNITPTVTAADWANARLIAAAPDMLAALREIVRLARPRSEIARIAQAALAQATKGAP